MQIYFCSVIMKNMYYKYEVNPACSFSREDNKKEQHSCSAALVVIVF